MLPALAIGALALLVVLARLHRIADIERSRKLLHDIATLEA